MRRRSVIRCRGQPLARDLEVARGRGQGDAGRDHGGEVVERGPGPGVEALPAGRGDEQAADHGAAVLERHDERVVLLAAAGVDHLAVDHERGRVQAQRRGDAVDQPGEQVVGAGRGAQVAAEPPHRPRGVRRLAVDQSVDATPQPQPRRLHRGHDDGGRDHRGQAPAGQQGADRPGDDDVDDDEAETEPAASTARDTARSSPRAGGGARRRGRPQGRRSARPGAGAGPRNSGTTAKSTGTARGTNDRASTAVPRASHR